VYDLIIHLFFAGYLVCAPGEYFSTKYSEEYLDDFYRLKKLNLLSMKRKTPRPLILLLALIIAVCNSLSAQQYVSPTQPTEPGKAPGLRVKLLHTEGGTKTYVLVFGKGDEVKSGLTEFAQRYKVTAAHFTGIGDAVGAKVGWYDSLRKAFKVIEITGASEISSIIGNITVTAGKPGVHAHVNLADEKGITHGGHLLEMYVGPTVELFVTVLPAAIEKKNDPASGAALIDAVH
jgi:predicted DNA-binding protein with PD1-like motif